MPVNQQHQQTKRLHKMLWRPWNHFLAQKTDTAGALIPYMEKYYDIGYAIVSLIFVGAALGYITAAPVVARVRNHLGLAKTFALSQTLICCGYIPIICGAPFPVIAISFFVVGFGCAVNLPLSNVFCASFSNAPTLLGLSAGAYGLGGIVSPLIATAMVTAGNLVWSRYYLVTLGLAAFNAIFAAWSFWDYDKELHISYGSAQTVPEAQRGRGSATLAAFKSRVVLLGALFVFTYQGAEVSVSGWVVSFLIETRGGDPSQVGYVSAGFWAGITVGRFLLSPLGHRLGEKGFIYGLVIGSAAFELLVWLVPNIIGNAVAVAIVGLLLGPVWPCATIVFTRNLSRKEQVSGLSIISAFGSSGGAFMPLAIGLLSQKIGTYVLHPVVIGLCGLMIIVWFGIPAARKRLE
ncbi:MFS efflux transporter [Truncatella angustata]|uniref:MFS efflux transporter n=1 Tax=Truncatella angustata TaxID=152316 RepID=A0A9P8UXB4_9PEZI|nr:MFS efflux transporter [Truncatella angustata]KAH6659888.1 MFS efflux transporter [Truncatella angustata]